MVVYTSNINDITPKELEGFFVGWAKPLTIEQHFNHLTKCTHFIAALEDDRVVGFVSAFSDGIACAFIPMIEVLPKYQKRGIGSELIRRMLEALKHIGIVDLMCDESVQDFYERFGMKKLTGMGIRRE